MTTKIYYFHDPKNYNRVITVVANIERDVITFGYSMNRPDRWRVESETDNWFSQSFEKGDQFSKTKGKLIATGRLKTSPISCKNELPTARRAILKCLSQPIEVKRNMLIERICSQLYNEDLEDDVVHEFTSAV